MAGFFQEFLGGFAQGFAGNPNLRDFTHASKTFTTNAFGNAPKFKWLFHVYFDINRSYITNNIAGLFPDTTNYGLLVKNIQLPKFQPNIVEMNQYNRKRYIQTKIQYDPVSIVFHDDNLSQIKNLWTQYYNYYYWDASSGGKAALPIYNTPGALASALNGSLADRTNIYNPNIAQDQTWGYSGNPSVGSTNGTKAAFFKSIRIYGFNQHDFAGYELINPIISNFGHDQYNYYETNGIMENTMTIRYESVNYFNGKLKGNDPTASVNGFGSEAYYDRRPSPITNPGSTRSVLGQGGLLDAASNIYDNIARGDVRGALGAAQTAIRTVNTFGNTSNLTRAISSEAIAGAVGIIGAATRSIVNSPSQGATTGRGSQSGSATNTTNGTATPPFVP